MSASTPFQNVSLRKPIVKSQPMNQRGAKPPPPADLQVTLMFSFTTPPRVVVTVARPSQGSL